MAEELPGAARAGNDALRAQVESMLESYEQQRSALVAAQQRAAEPVTVWSPDNLVRVTATVAGVLEVHLQPEAFKRSTSATLGPVITATLREAAGRAAAKQAEALAPFTDLPLPDLPDLIPGAPATKDVLAQLDSSTAEAATTPASDSIEDEDDYFRNRGYLR
ncbi:YbaB/EbfC family nucleoid-associated protein [Nocardia asteroides]|uniref:YbaB/EbfC family nucleoid-associated protein n=1 Tax=Nocardia asteroides TaxID=1824 RepID=UPI001E62003E|nr:YbaB/EbfC family nucleoid-associated protein [Nocardia asteroides]UGT59977.1 YbaB/EbfC family nucleoid-associated protein [Nocardia asteroides]